MPDELYIQRQEQFCDLFERYYTDICRYFTRRTELDAVEDLAGEVFLVAWRRLDDLPKKELQWLYGIAANVLGNHWRGTKRRAALNTKVQDEGYEYQQDVLDVLMNRGLSGELATAFAQLSESEREVMLLMYVEQLTTREAAKVLGCSTVALRARTSRVRRKLRALLAAEQGETAKLVANPTFADSSRRLETDLCNGGDVS